jgi:hypothetical protein
MTIKVKKLYRGCVDVKSYDRKECMDKKENLIIIHDDKKMTLTPVHVKVKIKAKSALFTSKIGMEDYYLYSYKWNPDINQE